MKKLLFLMLVFVSCAAIGYAANPFDEFKNNISGVAAETAQKNLDNFTKDLGALLAGGGYHNGENLGFPGFDLGVHVPIRKVRDDDAIMKAANLSTVLLPIAQLEIGLPAKFDLLARYLSYYDSTLVGGGLRYGIIRGVVPGMPSLSVQAVYNTLDVKAGANRLKATSLSASAIGSLNLPVVKPYLGIGMVSTTVEPDASIATPLAGMQGKADEVRIEGGINLSPFPFTYLQLGGVYSGGEIGYTAGLGVAY